MDIPLLLFLAAVSPLAAKPILLQLILKLLALAVPVMPTSPKFPIARPRMLVLETSTFSPSVVPPAFVPSSMTIKTRPVSVQFALG